MTNKPPPEPPQAEPVPVQLDPAPANTLCRVCACELKPLTPDWHHEERSPLGDNLCSACWVAALELEMYLLRKRDRTIMGPWAEDVLRELLAEDFPRTFFGKGRPRYSDPDAMVDFIASGGRPR